MKEQIASLKTLFNQEIKQNRIGEVKYCIENLIADLLIFLFDLNNKYLHDKITADRLSNILTLFDGANPKIFEAIGEYFYQENNPAKAIESLVKASELKKEQDSQLLCNIALICGEIGNFDLRKKYYNKARKIKNDSKVKFGLGLHCLAVGEFQQGWKLYEERYKVFPHLRDITSKYQGMKKWRGELDAKIVIFNEQGIGDLIFAMRYLPILDNLGIEYYLDVSEQNKNLFTSAKSKFKFYNIQNTTHYCSIMSLPHILNEYEFHSGVYKKLFIQHKNPKNSKPKIGITVAGSKTHPSDHRRSIRISTLNSLLNQDKFEFHLLQRKEDRTRLHRNKTVNILDKNYNLKDRSNEMNTFQETYKILHELDALVTVDTSIAHMAGSIGMPTYLLLDKGCDYRWHLDETKTPWYNSWRLIKQKTIHEWSDVVHGCINLLHNDFLA